MSIHIAIFGCPLPALTHPTMSVVATLVRRGYRVTYVTSERFAAEAAALGAEVLRCPRLVYPFDQDPTAAMPIEHQYARGYADLATRTYAQLLPFYQKNRPALILYDLVAFAGMLVADTVGTTAIRMSNQFDFTPQTLASPELSPKVRSDVLESERQANDLLDTHRSQRRNVILNGLDPTVYFYLRVLQLSGSTTGPDVFYAARCLAERPNIPRWTRTAPRNKPLVLVSSSTTYKQSPQYYRECLVALSQKGWESILVAGGSALSDFGSLPTNCHAIQDIALFSVMPHIDLLICGAGMATAMEALYHGVPMLMLTSGHAELEAYARMYESRGLGIHLEENNAGPDSVAYHAMCMYQNPDLRLSLKRMQEAVNTSAGAEELVNWLEQRMGQP